MSLMYISGASCICYSIPKFCCIPQLYSFLPLLSKTAILCLCAMVLKRPLPLDRKTGRSSCNVGFMYFFSLREHDPLLPIAHHLKPFVSNILQFNFTSFIVGQLVFACYCLMAKSGSLCITSIKIFMHIYYYGMQTVKVMDLIFSTFLILLTII